MSAILSADDLNDFISPGVACIKPVESLPASAVDPSNPYEVRNEDKVPEASAPAQISLTDCLACSGCVTSAEAVLVQLQSVREVLDNLTSSSSGEKTFVALVSPQTIASLAASYGVTTQEARNMVGWLLSESSDVGIQGKVPLSAGEGRGGKGFTYVLDTDLGRDISLVYAFEEVWKSLQQQQNQSLDKPIKSPILTSACPGFICYAEAVHPYLISHLSRLKSPQAILGTLAKTLLPLLTHESTGRESGPQDVYVIGIQPCFDKKLEGARGELTNVAWSDPASTTGEPVRDVDCVITTRELIQLADDCGISFANLPRTSPPSPTSPTLTPSSPIHNLLVSSFSLPAAVSDNNTPTETPSLTIGTSGGYLLYILTRLQSLHPTSYITITKGRNSDTVEYSLLLPPTADSKQPTEIVKFARSYGFRNIQNLVRKLKPATKKRVLPRFGRKGAAAPVAVPTATPSTQPPYAYVEVMACPGGCTNGGGQVKVDDPILGSASSSAPAEIEANGGTNGDGAVQIIPADVGIVQKQREWLAKVDEAYWSSDDAHTNISNGSLASSPPLTHQSQSTTSIVNGTSQKLEYTPQEQSILSFVNTWSRISGVEVDKLVYTSYRKVDDDFSKEKEEKERREAERNKSSVVRAAELATKAGGGW
ncbi:putative iron-sulfur cluster assembly associated protein Nar1 [Peziza echinospora]|nr:putative iron-sulfur cluster assembly associated protein Nar1 [Peziza echinospora]